MWLLPSPSLWTAEEALVVTPSRNYSAHDYDDLFEAVGFTDGPGLLARVQDLTSDFTDPAVSVYPRYGTGVATPQQYVYAKDDDWDTDPSIVSDMNGDGTVPLRALVAGDGWSQSSPLVYDGASHSGILSDTAFIADIVDIATIA